MREIEICEIPVKSEDVRIVIIRWCKVEFNQNTEMIKQQLDDVVSKYLEEKSYNEFISKHQDNPYVRVLISGINELTFTKFNME